METFLGILTIILLFVSILCLILGLIQPKIFNKLFKQVNRKKTSLIFGLAFVTSLILIGIFSSGTPSLAAISSPTNQRGITVSGSTSYKNSTIKIFVNGNVVTETKADNEGHFSMPVELQEGQNKIKVSATNNKNKIKSSSEKNVVLDITPPDFSFDQPQSPTSSDKLILKGKSEKNAQIILYSADKEIRKVKIKNDLFEMKDILLSEGENKFTIKAVDEADNYSQPKEIVIVYTKAEEAPKESDSPDQTPTPEPTTPAVAPESTPAPVPSETTSQKNAVRKAKSYLDYTAFSHDGLVDQLEYEQFSHADAVYGADNSGANWNEQAAKKAKSYMEYSVFSRGSLIAQLEYDKFTRQQAEYGASAAGL